MSIETYYNKTNLWSPGNIRLGKLLLAVAEMQSFIHGNWTSAQVRHRIMPTSKKHWTRSQMRCSSMLAVHLRPVPDSAEEKEPNTAVKICVRQKRLSEAWKMMQSCDTELWADVCNLYSMVVSVEQNPGASTDDKHTLDEVDEAKNLMRNTEILSAVETIKSYDQEEWRNAQATPSTPWALHHILHRSILTVHDHHHNQSPLESKIRHAEHADAWQTMNKCAKGEWTAACQYHEGYNAKREKLDAAVSVIQDFNAENWTSAHLRHKTLPASEPHWTATQIRHGASLAVRSCPVPETEREDPAYQFHREKMIEAWQIMKESGSTEWVEACKSYEDIVLASLNSKKKDMTAENATSKATSLKSGCPFYFRRGFVRAQPPVRNGVSGHAA